MKFAHTVLAASCLLFFGCRHSIVWDLNSEGPGWALICDNYRTIDLTFVGGIEEKKWELEDRKLTLTALDGPQKGTKRTLIGNQNMFQKRGNALGYRFECEKPLELGRYAVAGTITNGEESRGVKGGFELITGREAARRLEARNRRAEGVERDAGDAAR